MLKIPSPNRITENQKWHQRKHEIIRKRNCQKLFSRKLFVYSRTVKNSFFIGNILETFLQKYKKLEYLSSAYIMFDYCYICYHRCKIKNAIESRYISLEDCSVDNFVKILI